MTKHLQNVEQEESLTPEEQLEAILFQFVNLYERWAEDRQKAAKQSADIEKFIKQFASEVDRFSAIENAVIEKLKKSLSDTTVTISSMVYDAVSHSVDRSLDNSARKIRESADYAENVFSEYKSSLNLSHWKLVAITALSSIAASLLIVWFLMPKPTLPLTGMDMQTYELGKTFSELWTTLPEEKKKWFLGKTKDKASTE